MFSRRNIIGLSFNASAQESSSIPSWIKTTAKFWVNGDVSDSDFLKAIQWLVTQGIIVVPNTSSTNSNTQITPSTSSSVTNVLTPMLPTSTDTGPLWQPSPATSSTLFDILATQSSSGPPDIPHYTIEQIFTKNLDTPPTVITIDMTSFQSTGLSMSAMNDATLANEKMMSYYQNQNIGAYTQASFSPTPTDPSENCYIFSISKTESTKIDMYCMKGYTEFVIDATGNDLTMLDEVKTITNAMLLKITGYH
jgi:hypothetical protein